MKLSDKQKINDLNQEIFKLSQQMNRLKKRRAKLVKSTLCCFKFKCSFEVILNEDEIWPDEDAPINPTVKDVNKLLSSYTSHGEVMSDWSLAMDCYKDDSCKIIVTKFG